MNYTDFRMLTDRAEAGRKLAQALEEYKGLAVVAAIPRGGVVLGAEIAGKLEVPMDLVLVRKVGHPSNPEYAVGAVTEHGQKLNEAETEALDRRWLVEQIQKERREIGRRREIYLKDRKEIDLTGKTVILVDDGVATGLTFLAAVDDLRRRGAGKIVAALPVMPVEFMEALTKAVDEVVCLNIDKDYLGAVGAYYESFPQVTDEEVTELMGST